MKEQDKDKILAAALLLLLLCWATKKPATAIYGADLDLNEEELKSRLSP